MAEENSTQQKNGSNREKKLSYSRALKGKEIKLYEV